MPKNTNPKSDLDWTTLDEEVPNPQLPDGIRLASRQRRYRWMVWSTVVIAPIALFSVVIVAGAKSATTHPQVVATGSQASSPGRTAATLELNTWLNQVPSPLPGATVLSWDGAVAVPAVPSPQVNGQSATAGSVPTWNAEIDNFTLVVQPTQSTSSSTTASSQTVYDAGVEVAINPAGGGAIAIGGPSITVAPPPASNNWQVGGPWPGLSASASVSQPVQSAINGWLVAYTSGSSSALGLSVGDPNLSRGYLPLSGVTSATDSVIAAANRPNDAEIVNISLSITWSGSSTSTTQSNGSSTPPLTTMDVLVERASTAAPVVVAWGPSGSGPTLRPYQNSVPQSVLSGSGTQSNASGG